MGRPSPATKKKKRQRQKLRRKQKFTATSGATDSSEAEHSSGYVVGRVLPDEIGEDTDVMHMELEDFYREWDNSEHSNTYLKECRQKLLEKVKEYHQKVEQLQTEKIEIACKHRAKIEEIRTFYRNIAYGTSRSGRMVKKAMSTSDAAKEVMKMLGYDELQKRLAMDSSDDNI